MSKKTPLFVYKNISTDAFHQQALTEIGTACNISRLIYYYHYLRTYFVELCKKNIQELALLLH